MCLDTGAHITRDKCFLVRGAHITRDMCFLGRGTHTPRDVCFLGRVTYIYRDMCFPERGTQITRDLLVLLMFSRCAQFKNHPDLEHFKHSYCCVFENGFKFRGIFCLRALNVANFLKSILR